jgi:predicted enzyme related to lactoylglutathione lyase
MQNPFGRVEIYVADMERAQSFYEAVLQIKLETMPTPYSMDDGMQMLAFPSNYE